MKQVFGQGMPVASVRADFWGKRMDEWSHNMLWVMRHCVKGKFRAIILTLN